jgi:large subunit ribosomal protein L24
MPGLHIRTNDTVVVISGKDKGKQGRVVRVYPDRGRVMVEGVNQVKRHEKLRVGQGRAGTTGGIITKELPVDASNVAVVCGSCGRGTRVGFETGEGGKRRVCRRCGSDL